VRERERERERVIKKNKREEKEVSLSNLVGKNDKLGVKLFLLIIEIPLRCFWPSISPEKLDQS
jgi:hypothetical protein